MNLYYIPPDGFYIGSFEIKFYGLIMSVAMLIGIILACFLAKKRGVKSDDIILLALIILPCAVVGARLYYCFFMNTIILFGNYLIYVKVGLQFMVA